MSLILQLPENRICSQTNSWQRGDSKSHSSVPPMDGWMDVCVMGGWTYSKDTERRIKILFWHHPQEETGFGTHLLRGISNISEGCAWRWSKSPIRSCNDSRDKGTFWTWLSNQSWDLKAESWIMIVRRAVKIMCVLNFLDNILQKTL